MAKKSTAVDLSLGITKVQLADARETWLPLPPGKRRQSVES
jgi:hypothetical protein